MNLTIRNGRVIDPANQIDAIMDVAIKDGKISTVGQNLPQSEKEIDVTGLVVAPGFVDLHAHLRQPGYEYKETIATGTASAAMGGYTSVVCMANTKPVIDNVSVVKYILDLAKEQGKARVYPVGSITKGLEGKELSEMGELVKAGCVAFSDDGRPVENGYLMRLAMQYAAQFGKVLLCHQEDLSLLADGVMNEGYVSTVLGLKGASRAAEEAMIARDIVLAETLNLPVHCQHVSTTGGAQLIREAKARGVKVSAETAPHYLYATDELCLGYNTNAKMNPPLRTKEDQIALQEALLDGTIDCIATDHAPHSQDEKNIEFAQAYSGIIGFETALPLCLTAFGDKVTLSQLVYLMSTKPASIIGLDAGTLLVGSNADIVVFDPNISYTIDISKMVSKCKNTPFDGHEVKGRVVHTILGGEFVVKDSKLVE